MIRTFLISAALALGVAGGAMAAQSAEGTITDLNAQTGFVTLDGAQTYLVPDEGDLRDRLDRFKEGDEVTILYQAIGNSLEVVSVQGAS